MRTPLSFDCEGATLVGTLDAGARATGLLIVTGGTQTRTGAHGGQARLAAAVARAGFPAFRFDRRGVGDSDGADPGFAASNKDLAAAVAAFRQAQPHLRRLVGYGLCDGAATLALHGGATGLDALVLANPWVVRTSDGLPPPAAIRRRYRERIASRETWGRLIRGKVDLAKTARGLWAVTRPAERDLAASVAEGLRQARLPVSILLATGDATAIAYEDAAGGSAFKSLEVHTERRDTTSHGFAGTGDADWLAARVIAALDAID